MKENHKIITTIEKRIKAYLILKKTKIKNIITAEFVVDDIKDYLTKKEVKNGC